MTDNITVTQGSGTTLRTNESGGVHTPVHAQDATQHAAVVAALEPLATAASQTTIIGHVDGIETKLDLLGTAAQMTTVIGHVDGIETGIGLLATAAQMTTLTGHVDGLEGQLTTLNASVGTVGTRAYGTVQRVAIGLSEVDTTGLTCTEVTLHATAACFVVAGATPTATVAAGIPLAAGEKFTMRITSGHQISVIGEVATGYLYVCPVA